MYLPLTLSVRVRCLSLTSISPIRLRSLESNITCSVIFFMATRAFTWSLPSHRSPEAWAQCYCWGWDRGRPRRQLAPPRTRSWAGTSTTVSGRTKADTVLRTCLIQKQRRWNTNQKLLRVNSTLINAMSGCFFLNSCRIQPFSSVKGLVHPEKLSTHPYLQTQVGNNHSKDLIEHLFGPEVIGKSGQVLQRPFKPRVAGVGAKDLSASLQDLMFLLEPVFEAGPNEAASCTQLLGKRGSSWSFFPEQHGKCRFQPLNITWHGSLLLRCHPATQPAHYQDTFFVAPGRLQLSQLYPTTSLAPFTLWRERIIEGKCKEGCTLPLIFLLTRQNLIKVDGQQQIQGTVKGQYHV